MPPTLSIDRHSTTDTIHTWYGVVHLFDRKKMEKQVRCCGSLNLNPQYIESCWEKGCSVVVLQLPVFQSSSPSVRLSVRPSVVCCLSGGQEYKRTHAHTLYGRLMSLACLTRGWMCTCTCRTEKARFVARVDPGKINLLVQDGLVGGDSWGHGRDRRP